ncbi:uncharacterized protein METZ01_LOCUS514407, partial [marine metagenome]
PQELLTKFREFPESLMIFPANHLLLLSGN